MRLIGINQPDVLNLDVIDDPFLEPIENDFGNLEKHFQNFEMGLDTLVLEMRVAVIFES